MFFRSRKKRRESYVPEDERLRQVIGILFPPLETEDLPDGSRVQIDYSVDSNLDAVLLDLEDGHNDESARSTLRDCIKRVARVRDILEAHHQIDLEAKALFVDTPREVPLEDAIIASD